MEAFLGMITPYGFNFAPRGWATCSGQLLAIAQNSALFSLLGTNYGGDGRTSFGLPDLRGYAPVGQGQHPGSNYDWRMGQRSGYETHTLSILELPTHNHMATFSSAGAVLQATTDDGTSATPEEGYMLAKTVATGTAQDQPELIYAPASSNTVNLAGIEATGQVTIGNTGGSNSFNLMQPSLGVNYSICMQGIFPSRN